MHVEHLILHTDHLTEIQGDVTTHDDVAMAGRRRFVKRAGRFSAPIRQDRLMTFVGQSQTADISMFALGVIQSAEHQSVLDGAQLGEAILIHGGEGVPLGALGRRAMRTGCAHRIQTGADLCPKRVQTVVCAADCLLLLMQLGGITRHVVIPSCKNSGNQIYSEASTKTWGPKRMTMNGR